MAKKHTLTVHYNNETDISVFKVAFANLIFTPYTKGKKYEKSAEMNEKIPLLQMLMPGYWDAPIQTYLDEINNDVMGFGQMIEDTVLKMQGLNGSKFEITIDVKKIG